MPMAAAGDAAAALPPGVPAGLATQAMLATGTSVTISDLRLPDDPLVWVNPAFETTTGYRAEWALGRNCRFLQGPDTDPATLHRIREALRRQEPIRETLLNYRADGTSFWNHVAIDPVRGPGGDVTHFVGVQTDVTRRVEAEQERKSAYDRADRSLAAERESRRAAEAAQAQAELAQRRLALLAEATGMLAATLDVEESLERLCRLAVPLLADWVTVTLVDPSGRVSRVSSRHRHGHADLVQRWVALQPGGLTEESTTLRVLASREPLLVPATDASYVGGVVRGNSLAELAGALGGGAALVVPLVVRRRVLGVLALVAVAGGRDFDDGDLAVATDLGRRAALALDNARLYDAEHTTAVALQRSLLPVLPEVAGLAFAAAYLPGSDEAEVGGDWYDVLALPDGATALAIGDVMGHDLAAAAAMGQLRSVLRSYAWEGDDPGPVLDRLDRLVQGLGMADLATCIYARMAAAEGGGLRLTYANAGHHAPLLRMPDGRVETLDGGRSVVIGIDPGLAGDAGRAQASCLLPAGSVLLLYTDGLIESRDQDLEVGLAAVRARLAEHDPSEGPEALTRDLAERLLDRGQDDDVCLLAVHVH